MARMTYAVLKTGDHWQIVSERRRIGQYNACQHAATAAVCLAHEARAAGHDVEILVQDVAGRLWPVARFDSVETMEPLDLSDLPEFCEPAREVILTPYVSDEAEGRYVL